MRDVIILYRKQNGNYYACCPQVGQMDLQAIAAWRREGFGVIIL